VEIGEQIGVLDMTNLSDDLDVLSSDFVWLKELFNMFDRLFCSGQERVDLMNEVSGHFFALIDKALLAEIVHGLFRISGSKSTGRGKETKHNLVLLSLADVSLHGDWDGRAEYEIRAIEAKEALAPLADMRNWTLAHRDADHARGEKVIVFPKLKEVRAAIFCCEAALRFAQGKIRQTDYVFDLIDSEDDALRLLDVLRIGLAAERLEEATSYEQAKAGNYNYTPTYGPRPEWLMPKHDPFTWVKGSEE